MDKRRSALVYAVAVAVIWGLSFLSTKVAISVLPPMTIAASRFVIAVVLLLGLALATREKLASQGPRPAPHGRERPHGRHDLFPLREQRHRPAHRLRIVARDRDDTCPHDAGRARRLRDEAQGPVLCRSHPVLRGSRPHSAAPAGLGRAGLDRGLPVHGRGGRGLGDLRPADQAPRPEVRPRRHHVLAEPLRAPRVPALCYRGVALVEGRGVTGGAQCALPGGVLLGGGILALHRGDGQPRGGDDERLPQPRARRFRGGGIPSSRREAGTRQPRGGSGRHRGRLLGYDAVRGSGRSLGSAGDGATKRGAPE